MSFFFTKQKERRQPTTGRAPVLPLREQAAVLNRLGCKACPLDKVDVTTPKMKPTLVRETLVYFLAEAPGKDEDENTGRPLTGPSGKLLRQCIPDGQELFCSFDNVVNCRPPQNRTPTQVEQECCRPRRVKWIEEAGPKLIVGLGAVPLRWALGSSDLAEMRGRLFVIKIGQHTCHFMPTYHPSFVLRTAHNKKKPLHSKMGHCLRMDIQRAFSLAGGLKQPKIYTEAEMQGGVACYDGSQADDFDQVIAQLRWAATCDVKAVDLETKGLRPYAAGAAVMSAAVSAGTGTFSFVIDHPKAGWKSNQRDEILAEFYVLLTDKTIKVAHNLPFELEWLISLYGKGVVDHAVWQCTQMQAHFLDERRTGQSLEFLVKQHFGVIYKSLFKLNKKDMSKSDLGETLTYNGVDAKYTLQLYHYQSGLLKRARLHSAYLGALPRQATVALMQHLGIGVDQTEVKRIQDKLGGEIKGLEDEINNLKVVKAYIKDHRAFNPLSIPDVISVFKDYLKRPEIEIKGENTTRYSVDKHILDKIDHPLAELIVQLRNKTKLKATYCDGLELGKGSAVYPDGKIHCNFNTTFTVTGRTSSDLPNMQNYPQRNDSWVRKQIVPGKNHVLVACDYGQLEGCTAAMCSKDKVLVQALREDYDIHMEWAVRTAKKYPAAVDGSMSDPKVAKAFRSRIKNKLVFPAIFGAQNDSIAGYLGIPENIVDELMDEFWGTFTGLRQWQNELMASYYETGYVESPTGRRHYYPLTRNEAINMPVQCLASDIVCDAMCVLSAKAARTAKWYLHPVLNIHDDLSFIIPDDDKILGPAIEDIYRIMLNPIFPCVNVPLSVSVSVGRDWYEMEHLGVFRSNKDL